MVLAVHTWPDKPNLSSARGESHPQWTGWSYLSQRRLAVIAGCDKDTVGNSLRQLVASGLMQFDGSGAGRRNHFRLLRTLYPSNEEKYATIPAMLIYGGVWHLLPTMASRHLYLVLAILDPVGDEEAYLAKLSSDGLNWTGDELAEWQDFDRTSINQLQRQRYLGEVRSSSSVSIADLTRYSGMSRNSVKGALRQLEVPMFGNQVCEGESGKSYRPVPLIAARDGWRVPDRGAWNWFWNVEFLQNRESIEAQRRKLWPWIHERREMAGDKARSS
jgi:hypothetical protein